MTNKPWQRKVWGIWFLNGFLLLLTGVVTGTDEAAIGQVIPSHLSILERALFFFLIRPIGEFKQVAEIPLILGVPLVAALVVGITLRHRRYGLIIVSLLPLISSFIDRLVAHYLGVWAFVRTGQEDPHPINFVPFPTLYLSDLVLFVIVYGLVSGFEKLRKRLDRA